MDRRPCVWTLRTTPHVHLPARHRFRPPPPSPSPGAPSFLRISALSLALVQVCMVADVLVEGAAIGPTVLRGGLVAPVRHRGGVVVLRGLEAVARLWGALGVGVCVAVLPSRCQRCLRFSRHACGCSVALWCVLRREVLPTATRLFALRPVADVSCVDRSAPLYLDRVRHSLPSALALFRQDDASRRSRHHHSRPHDRRRALRAIHPLRSLCGR